MDSLHLKTIQNLQITALCFFFVIGFIHIISGILLFNNYYINTNYLINNSFDIPFVMSGSIYGLSSIKLFFLKHQYTSKLLDTTLIMLGAILFIILIYFNLFTPDKI